MAGEDNIFIVGHKNPDTDSICSAVSLAYLRNQSEKTNRYHARRAGQLNEETEFVLKYFGVEPPKYMPNVGQQVRDLVIDETEGAPDDITIRIAWEYMQESGVSSLPIMNSDNELEGMLAVSDIINFFMDAYTKTLMSEAKSKYFDIAETVNGHVIVGDEQGLFTEGRVIVGAAAPENFAKYMEPKDLVILSDREDTQLCAIDNGASCIVLCLCDNASVLVKIEFYINSIGVGLCCIVVLCCHCRITSLLIKLKSSIVRLVGLVVSCYLQLDSRLNSCDIGLDPDVVSLIKSEHCSDEHDKYCKNCNSFFHFLFLFL